jgi:hypothetical protein
MYLDLDIEDNKQIYKYLSGNITSTTGYLVKDIYRKLIKSLQKINNKNRIQKIYKHLNKKPKLLISVTITNVYIKKIETLSVKIIKAQKIKNCFLSAQVNLNTRLGMNKIVDDFLFYNVSII